MAVYALSRRISFWWERSFDGTNIECEVQAIYDEEGNSMDSAPHPKQKLRVKLDKEFETGIILRRKE